MVGAGSGQRRTGHDASGGVIDPSFGGTLGAAAEIVSIAAAAGQLIHARFGTPGDVAAKGDVGSSGRVFDVVTEVDMACEALIVDHIRRISPGAVILAEEGGVHDAHHHTDLALLDDLWVVDPLDGTLNFSAGLPMCAVSIAHYRRGEIVAGVIHAPMLAETWTIDETGPRCNGAPIRVNSSAHAHQTVLAASGSGKDLAAIARPFRSWRRVGSAALSLAWVAGGRFGAYVQMGALQPWDLAVGAPLVQAAGGVITDHHLRPWTINFDSSTGLVASAETIFPELTSTLESVQ